MIDVERLLRRLRAMKGEATKDTKVMVHPALAQRMHYAYSEAIRIVLDEQRRAEESE